MYIQIDKEINIYDDEYKEKSYDLVRTKQQNIIEQ